MRRPTHAACAAQRSAVLPPGCLSTPFSRLLLQAIVARLRRRELYKYVTDALIPKVSRVGQSLSPRLHGFSWWLQTALRPGQAIQSAWHQTGLHC